MAVGLWYEAARIAIGHQLDRLCIAYLSVRKNGGATRGISVSVTSVTFSGEPVYTSAMSVARNFIWGGGYKF